jgi:hypothetical protein
MVPNRAYRNVVHVTEFISDEREPATHTTTCSKPRNTKSIAGKWMAMIFDEFSRDPAPSHTAVHTRKLQPMPRRTQGPQPSPVLEMDTVCEYLINASVLYRCE